MASYPYLSTLEPAAPEELVPLVPLRPIANVANSAAPPAYVTLPPEVVVSGFTRTSHLIPAASPRNLPSASPLRDASDLRAVSHDLDAATAGLGEARRVFEERKSRGVVDASVEQQWICVDRYVPRRPPPGGDLGSGFTLFFTHSGGFYRQIWEPMLARLLSGPARALISEVWTFEAIQHGDSALINDAAQRDVGEFCLQYSTSPVSIEFERGSADGMGSTVVDWHDLARDILHFLTHYLPLEPCEDLGTVLSPVSQDDRAVHHRKVVGVGHSFGGTVLARATLEHPHLFSALILVEPMIFSTRFNTTTDAGAAALGFLLRATLQKQPAFASRADAEAYLARYPTTARWHPDVRANFREHGFAPCEKNDGDEGEGEQGVRLKTRPFDEAAVTFGWRHGHEVWSALADLDERVALHWIMSGKSAAWCVVCLELWLLRRIPLLTGVRDLCRTGGRAMTHRTVWRRPHNSTNVLVPDAGHSVLQEKPDALALHIAAFLRTQRRRQEDTYIGSDAVQALVPYLMSMAKL
ncbi:Alpha/beta hydrolase family-domain-containing protein [Earliella scabrosa]|nr:Alpha/beta hydrolase family-domain-containing protein [Earliella scabrosa]